MPEPLEQTCNCAAEECPCKGECNSGPYVKLWGIWFCRRCADWHRKQTEGDDDA